MNTLNKEIIKPGTMFSGDNFIKEDNIYLKNINFV
jgi:hypothetical protein